MIFLIIFFSFDDLDLEEDSALLCSNENPNLVNESDSEEPCCAFNWIKIGSAGSSQVKRFCGRSENRKSLPRTFISKTSQVWVKFHTLIKLNAGRGFHLTYIVSPSKSNKCKSDEFRCTNGKCIADIWRCNRRDECGDHSDEINCDDVCVGANQAKCGGSQSIAPGCYSFPFERCDGEW